MRVLHWPDSKCQGRASPRSGKGWLHSPKFAVGTKDKSLPIESLVVKDHGLCGIQYLGPIKRILGSFSASFLHTQKVYPIESVAYNIGVEVNVI